MWGKAILKPLGGMDDKDDNSSIHSLSAGKLTMKDHSCSCNHSTKDMKTISILEDYKCV